MKHWWEVATSQAPEVPKPRAVAYCRHSAQDRQENSIPLQQEQVREFAEQHGIEIIKEFADAGKSGLNVEGRPAFTEMMEQWGKKRKDFSYILCLDVSRWGRFQDIDRSAQYCGECKDRGKQVIYTTIGKPRKDDPLYPVYVQFERFRAAQYSKELSDKVWRGCIKIAEQGYWAGGKPPYGFQRLLLDESREPVGVLEPGKTIGNTFASSSIALPRRFIPACPSRRSRTGRWSTRLLCWSFPATRSTRGGVGPSVSPSAALRAKSSTGSRPRQVSGGHFIADVLEAARCRVFSCGTVTCSASNPNGLRRCSLP